MLERRDGGAFPLQFRVGVNFGGVRPGWAEKLPELFEEERARATIAHVFNRTAEGNRGKSEQ
jgi:hypothetical protein